MYSDLSGEPVNPRQHSSLATPVDSKHFILCFVINRDTCVRFYMRHAPFSVLVWSVIRVWINILDCLLLLLFFWSVIQDRILFIRWVLFELDFWGTHVVRIDIYNCASLISVIRMRSRDLVINKVIYVLRDFTYILCDAMPPLYL